MTFTARELAAAGAIPEWEDGTNLDDLWSDHWEEILGDEAHDHRAALIRLAVRHRERASKVFGDGWKLRKYRGRYDGIMALFTAADLAEFPDDDIPNQELLIEAYADGEVHVQASCKWQPRYTREIHKAHAIAAAWKAHEANLTAAINPTPPNVQGYCEFCERAVLTATKHVCLPRG